MRARRRHAAVWSAREPYHSTKRGGWQSSRGRSRRKKKIFPGVPFFRAARYNRTRNGKGAVPIWNPRDLEEFYGCVADLLGHPTVQQMEQIPQHADGISCLDHCIFVSYLSFSLCRRWGLDQVAAARAGLLHDLYLCDWRRMRVNPWRRLLIHPQMALENARQFGLSALEQDIILKHMWPVTLRQIPRHRESAVVNLADKLCASAEFLGLYTLSGAREALIPFNRQKAAAGRLPACPH